MICSPSRPGVRLILKTKRCTLVLPCKHTFHNATIRLKREQRSREPDTGLTTPTEEGPRVKSNSPFYFEAGYACWAKRPSRAFPPPFFSPPSGSFSDPLSTTNRSRDMRRPKVNGNEIRGVTNGDDALLVSENLLATNDGVGAWAHKERGHAPLWSRLIVHFMGVAAEKDGYGANEEGKEPNPIQYMKEAYEATKEALSPPTEWFGTTTVTAAVLHWKHNSADRPVLYVSQLGDSKSLVVRPKCPKDKQIIFGTEEQWHYFDCPRQLGTNSPDTPEGNAVLSVVDVEEGDVVLTMSDGVTDNLWEYEIADKVVEALDKWKANSEHNADTPLAEAMKYVAQQLVLAARQIAEDPFAESPFMERAVEEGLAIEGGKPDDISVVAGLVQRKKT